MNQTVADNIRRERERRAWTQEQLAHAADLNVRTIQRAEDGVGIGAESLLAVAGALNVSLCELQVDPHLAAALGIPADQATPAEIDRRLQAAASDFRSRYWIVPIEKVMSSSVLETLSGADAMCFSCTATQDEIRDAGVPYLKISFEIRSTFGAR